MIILCCGDREWKNEISIERELETYSRDTVIIHGNARGADKLSSIVGKRLGFKEIISFPANWFKYGRAAGPIRNQQMIDEGKPDYIIAFHSDIKSSKGTKDMLNRASKHGIASRLVEF